MPTRPAPTATPPAWRDRIVGCLGEGGFATVWEVHPPSSSPYALKIAKAVTEVAARRMAREAYAMLAVGAPSVPALLEHGTDGDGHAWLAMELIRGASLGDLIASELPQDQRKALLRALLECMAQLHAAGVIHRDLKPDNIMVGSDGRLTVLDLGMARRVGEDPDDPFAAAIAGTAEYMAPEQLDSGDVSDRADVYSIGVIAYELSALHPPFTGDSIAVGRGHRAMRPPRLVDAAPEFEMVCNEALRKDPAQRPSIAELLHRLDSRTASDAGVARRRVTVPIAVVRERPQLVVVMWAELARLDRNVLAMLGAHKLRVVSQRGRRVLAVLLASDHATPSNEALGVGEALVELGAKVALHLAECVVSGERVSGPALASPETWLPSGAWIGLRLTSAFAPTVDRAAVPAGDGAGQLLTLAEPTASVLFGRDEVLAELRSKIATSEGGPGLVVVTGPVGVGKSTLAEALRQKFLEDKLRVYMAAIPPPGYDRGPAGGAQVFSPFLPNWQNRPMMPDLADETRALAKDAPLVMILDDVDVAERDMLDALEYMTLGGGERCALWVVCFGSEQLRERRPDFGERARRFHSLSLPGLDEEAAVALASKWLAPVDYLPVASLRPLLNVTEGNPLHIVSLCRELHERKAIQQRADGGFFLDTSTLDQLPPLALAQWMATRQMTGLPEETVALARVCAVLGESFDRVELAAVVEQLDESAGGRIDVDLEIGCAELCAAGLLEEDGPRLRFINGLVCDGIYAMLQQEEREAMHRLALVYWKHERELGNTDLVAVQRIARHARAIGDRESAGRTCAELARVAERAHRYVESEQQWSAALQFLSVESERAEAHLGRARARYRQQRVEDAIADAQQATAIARTLGDRERLVDALLEESTALDWAEDFATSAQRTEEARRCGSADPIRQNRLALAEARVLFRRQPADAADALKDVAERADDLGDHETTVIAAMLGGHAFLMRQGQFARAQEVYLRGEQACRRNGDQFHLAALLVNRIGLWSSCGDIDRGMADLREAILLAREHGQSIIERTGAYNLAELLLWREQLEESWQWAQRSLNLQERYGLRAAAPELLLTLRIAAARDDRTQVISGLHSLPADLNPECECFRAVLNTWLHPTPEGWRAVVAQAEALLESEQAVEVRALALATGVLDEETARDYLFRGRHRARA